MNVFLSLRQTELSDIDPELIFSNPSLKELSLDLQIEKFDNIIYLLS